MSSYFKLAWRNIWRVRNRTIITGAAIAFAMLFAIVMRGFQLGSYDLMIENAVEKYIGYIQIHKAGYFEDPTMENIFTDSDSLQNEILKHDNVKSLVTQFQGGALASYGVQTKGIFILGVDPELEKDRMNLDDRLISGEYLEKGDMQVLVAENLAKYLKIEPGDSLVIRGQGYHGVSADGLYRVKGIVKFPAPDMNSGLVVMDQTECQYLFGAESMVTEYCINLENESELEQTRDDLKKTLGDDYEVMTWYETRADLKQQIDSDNASGVIFLLLLYLVIAFGVLGTIMMMTMERKKEFGISIAVGMKKSKLVRIVVIETLMIGLMGLLAGIIMALPINYYFHTNPIELSGSLADAMESFGVEPKMPFAFRPSFYLNQVIAIVVIVFMALIYPTIRIFRLKVIKAIRS